MLYACKDENYCVLFSVEDEVDYCLVNLIKTHKHVLLIIKCNKTVGAVTDFHVKNYPWPEIFRNLFWKTVSWQKLLLKILI